MPSQSQWLRRLPEIIADLDRISFPIVDRASFEKAFRVGRRRAIQLMHHFEGRQSGRTFFLDRAHLLAKLRAQLAGGEFQAERIRRVRVSDELDRARKLAPARKLRIQTGAGVRDTRLADLPAGIHLRPGELRIEFFGTEDLLRHLFELSQAIANDYRKFEAVCEEI